MIDTWIDDVPRELTGTMDNLPWETPKEYDESYNYSVARWGKELVDKYISHTNLKYPLTPIRQIRNKFLELTTGKDKKWAEATELLTNFVKERLHIYTTKDDLKSEVWIYYEGIYIPQGRSEIKKILRMTLGQWYSHYIYGLVLNKVEVDTFIEPIVFFDNKYVSEVPVLNGILNIFTGELRPFDPKKIFFSKLPVTYDPSKQCPQIEAFLDSVLSSSEDKKFFYELGGFCLLGDYRFEKAVMFTGSGRNGKDKSLELIKRLMGAENCCALSLDSLEPNSFVISELYGKKVNLAGDIGGQDLKDTSLFKALTGRSLISAKRKFMRDIVFVNSAKFIFSCNNLPMVYDMSRGFWDRWILLEFPYSFVTQEEYDKTIDKSLLRIKDESIIDKITTPDELSGLLNLFLLGLNKLTIQKDFSYTKSCEDVKNLWIRKSNSFIAFCFDNLEQDYESKISKRELRRRYIDYCKTHRVLPKSDIVIKRTLQDNYGASEKDELILGGHYDRLWEGVKWK